MVRTMNMRMSRESDTYDKEDPPMSVGSTYRSMEEFKLALAQHAVKNEFEYMISQSEPSRFGAYCRRKEQETCNWRIHASTSDDLCRVIIGDYFNPCAHACYSTRRKKTVGNASKHWIAAKVKDWLVENPNLGAKDLRTKLKKHYKVKIHYKRVYIGMELARKQIFGDWDASFNNLYRFKDEIKKSSPGSQVIIDHHTIGSKIRFRRMFFTLKPWPIGYVAVDGHNWMYPVAFGVFDSETNENWVWFMQKLREAIGSPSGLAICMACRSSLS
ncbi:hypothetical protein U9M48_043996 [Paspalum notatum var. saurae]|uniref:Transposase MuDR plant domain-containing protein n=1 Tax=Paspalum notatum var. saurae TaxID=547442 RepID=A0AAQ3UU98_PASNO